MLRRIGHRGAAGHEPENSLAAFAFANEHGAETVELDVQLTQDGVPVVFHDRHLDRTTNASGYLRDYDFGALARDVRLTNGEPVPALEQVLAFVAGTAMKLYMEIKAPEATALAQDMATRLLPKDRLVISSLHHKALVQVKVRDPAQRTMALFACAPVDPVGLVRAAQAEEAGIGFESIDEATVRILIDAGIGVYAWTVNDPVDLQFAEELGLNGVFSDYVYEAN